MQYGTSYPYGKQEIKTFLKHNLTQDAKICDVGAGQGTYYHLLGPTYQWTAIEVFKPAAQYLKQFYSKVYEQDIRFFTYEEEYDLIIFGDVLEHMSILEAQKVIEQAKLYSKAIMIAIPYQYKQGALYGNQYEEHKQDDLTPENFNERYPGFRCIVQV